MLLELEKQKGFAWRGARVSGQARQANIRRQGGDGKEIPRRFQPRLAAGFDEANEEQLEAFDRSLPRDPLSALLRWLAGC